MTSESVSDEAITRTMSRCWEENQYLLCPHSAVAVSYHYQQTDRQQPRYGPRVLGSPGYSGFQGALLFPKQGRQESAQMAFTSRSCALRTVVPEEGV